MTRRLQVTPVVRRAGRVAALASLLGGEVALAAAYTARGTGWHFLLHSTLGAGAGLVLATVLATLRTRAASPPGQAVGWAVLGQAVSVTPDVLFAAARVPHRRWMDFFLAHISMHLTPQPLTRQTVLTAPCREGDQISRRRQGRWVDAEIKHFGRATLLHVSLQRGGERRVIRATPDHLWFAADADRVTRRVTTAALRPGMSLGAVIPRDNLRQSHLSPFGVAAGVVFGDGSKANLRGGTNGAYVDLWGSKDAQLLPYFNGAPTRPMTTAAGVPGLRVTGLPAAFKDRPDLGEGVPYLYGWLAGYFAADGTVGQRGSVLLHSADLDNMRFAQAIATRLGIVTLGILETQRLGYGTTPSALYALRFSRGHGLRPEFFLIREHRERYLSRSSRGTRLRWTVRDVTDPGDVDDVYCAVVPETETFALDGMIWTHNCVQCRGVFDDVAGYPCQPNLELLRGGPSIAERRLPRGATVGEGVPVVASPP